MFAVCAVFAVLGASCVQIVFTREIVAFTAGYDGNRQAQNNERLVLNKVLFNQGGGYNSNTGIFTAPVGGIYQFQIHGLTEKNSSFWIKLYHNDEYVISAFARQSGDYDSAGNSVFVGVRRYDTLNLRTVGRAGFYGESNDIYTTWSGHRIGPLCSEYD
ncbi:hypothetical protein BsWGS_03797 [Bradybaena similaris]